MSTLENVKECEELFSSINNSLVLSTDSKKMYLAIELSKRIGVELEFVHLVFRDMDDKSVDEQFNLVWNAYQLPERLRFFNQRA